MPPFRIMKMSLFFLFQIHIMDKSYIIAFWSPIQTLTHSFVWTILFRFCKNLVIFNALIFSPARIHVPCTCYNRQTLL